MRWRWLESAPAHGSVQMAVDVALMDRASATGEATFRVYEWTRPTLSFGRHETVVGRFDAAELLRRGYDAVRRPTGGRVLLHDGDVTYSVTAPATGDETVRAAFARVNRLLAAGIARLGVLTTPAAPLRREPRPGTDACFATPSAGELVVSGRKLVASAQRRDAGAFLQHGSILLADRQSALTTLSVSALGAPAPAATLEDALRRPVARTEVHAALRAALEAEVGPVEPLSASELPATVATLAAQFADPAWTWRR